MLNKILIFCLILKLLPLSAHSQVRINEVMANPLAVSSDTSLTGTEEWIELFNTSKDTIDISIYYLSDSKSKPSRYSVPNATLLPGYSSFVITGKDLYRYSGRGFRLSSGGEKLFLFDRYMNLLDSLKYPKQYPGIAYGYKGLSNDKGYIYPPSPGKINPDQVFNKFSNAIEMKPEAGFYSSPQKIRISGNKQAVIRYTLDGSEPNENSQVYKSPISADSILTLRARSYEAGSLPGPVVTSTYFVNVDHSLPVVSLTTDPDYFFDDRVGIYVDGTHGIAGNCNTSPKNFNQSWKRPINVELFDSTKRVINQISEVRIYGNCSRRWPQKSLLISAKEKYGSNKFSYKIFHDKDIKKFKSVILRNSGTDWNKTLMKDAFVQSITRETMDLEQQAYRPCVVYLNGQYWGIYNIREMMDDHYIKSNHQIKLSDIDMIENITLLKYGRRDDFNFLKDTLIKAGFESELSLKIMNRYVDMDNFMDYHIAEMYSANTDWPNNNIRYWKARTDSAKWRYMLYDTDMAFGSMAYILDPYIKIKTEKHRGMNLFVELQANKSFRYDFSQRFAVHIYSTYQAERIKNMLDSMVSILEPEVKMHFDRWGGNKTDWHKHLQVINDFAKHRPEYMMSFIQKENLMKPAVDVAITAQSGKLKVCGVHVGNHFSGKLFPGIVHVEISPDNGYKFSHWEGGNLKNGQLEIKEGEAVSLKAVFKPLK